MLSAPVHYCRGAIEIFKIWFDLIWMTIDSADDSKISNRTINTNRITKLRRSLAGGQVDGQKVTGIWWEWGGKKLSPCSSLSWVMWLAYFIVDRTNRSRFMLQCCVCLSSSVTLCIVAKRCVLEQKLLLTAYRNSYSRNRLVPKWMALTFVVCLEVVSRSCQPLRYIWR